MSAAAFALGLSLAGPQVADAAADARDESNPSAESGATPSPASATRSGADRGSAAERTAAGRGSTPWAGSRSAAAVPPAAARRVPAAEGSVLTARRAAVTASTVPSAPSAPSVPPVSVPPVPVPPASVPPVLVPRLPDLTASRVSASTQTRPAVGTALAVAGATAGATSNPAAAPFAIATQGSLDAAVRQGLNALHHRLVELPAGPLSNFLEGALLMVRRSFFNQAPRVVPSPQTTSAGDGTIRGRVGAVDLEGDTLTYTVTGDPQRGTVTVDSDGVYTYTPGAEYDGADSFTVTIAPQRRSLNILNLASDGSRVVTIQIGNPTVYDHPDIAVNLPDTSGRITITRSGVNQFIGTITLTNVTADSQAMWIDTSGRLGRISLEALTDNYWEFKARAAENGATVDVTLAYTAVDGTQNALLLNDVEMTVDPGGRYAFTGRLAPAPDIETTEVDVWDVIGKAYKPMYDNFRSTHNLRAGWMFSPVGIDFTGADFYADTITPLSYRQAGLYALDSESQPAVDATVPQALTPSSTPVTTPAQVSATATLSPVTAALSSGETVIIGRKNGSVELWTDGQKKQLQDAGWNSSVKTLLEYDLPLKDAGGNTVLSTFNGYISGTTLTVTGLGPGSKVVVGSEITGAGVAPGTKITRFVDQTAACTDTTCTTTTGTGSGGSDGYRGTYEVNISQKVGTAVGAQAPDDPGVRMPAGIVFTQKDVPAVATGFVVGLTNGAIELYTATHGWTELHPFETKFGGVVSMITYREGIVVGLDNGSVRQWNGPGADADPNTWKNNWTELDSWTTMRGVVQNRGTTGGVTALTPYNGPPDACVGAGCDGFLVGFADGSVWQYSAARDGGFSPGWEQRANGGFNSAVKGIVGTGIDSRGRPTFAVGLENGAVWQYLWTGGPFVGEWWAVREPGTNITAMVRDGDGYIVGLANGAVLQRNSFGRLSEIQGAGWGSAVNQIIPFESATVGQGFLVGLANGSVQAWKGSAGGWVELHNGGWSSGVAALAPARRTVVNDYGDPVSQDGVIVGLDNGTVQQWSGKISGTTGQSDWTQLEGIKNAAESVLSRKESLSCVDLRCSEQGALQDAVTFAKKLANGGQQPAFGASGGVGGAADPIFGDPLMRSAASDGTYKPIAFYSRLSPAGTAPAAVKFEGSIATYTGDGKCGTGNATCSVLKIPNNVANLDVYQADIKAGSLLESNTVGIVIQPATRIVKELDRDLFDFDDTFGGARFFLLSGLAQQSVQSVAMKSTPTPSLTLKLDTSPVAYGYMYVPDGFIPKFNYHNYSVGALLAAEIGPRLDLNLGSDGSVYAPTKDLPVLAVSTPGPLGVDTFQLSAGVKVGASLTLNGLVNATSAGVYAYAVPGMLVTYNTVGAPNKVQAAFNHYLDFNANDLKDVSGVSVAGTVTPYVNLLYGVVVDHRVPLIGGWSLFSISGGFENPLSATVCADRNNSCPAAGTGSGVANFYGVINDGTFTRNVFTAEKLSASAGVGNVLTVTQSALFNPTKLAIGQLLRGPGVAAGTTITKYLGVSEYGTQWEVSIPQKTIGGGTWGTHPSLTAYLAGAPVSLTLGSRGLLTFHAGALEAFTSLLSYNAKVPLYEVNHVINPRSAASVLV